MLAYINLGPVHAIKLICHEKVGIFINQLTLHQVKFTIFHAIKALQQLVFYKYRYSYLLAYINIRSKGLVLNQDMLMHQEISFLS
jgi:hypothetical protein